ncbi:MAG: guanylate kinase [Thiofilum sp.]|uniref:guanylate kinase n=1 Tax=Thiofilum sp. TaxID=2212733 RepID=UPI0025F1A567|nr:guanylate kinase [Thiofilum sp.]MBK8453086.1 guanylate kinase [Thiofilum sp.]
MKTGQLYIVSAPSGGGKTSLLNALRLELNDVVVSVSFTTRQARPGEEQGKHYHFVSVADFQQQIEQDNFLEYAQVFDNYYGTSRQTVGEQLKAGLDVILEIDWQGAQQVRQRTDNVISIFILPPSRRALEERLRNRRQDSDEIIARRMRDAQRELSHYNEYDYLVINDDFDEALQDLISIFRCQRLRLKLQQQNRASLLSQLVSE